MSSKRTLRRRIRRLKSERRDLRRMLFDAMDSLRALRDRP